MLLNNYTLRIRDLRVTFLLTIFVFLSSCYPRTPNLGTRIPNQTNGLTSHPTFTSRANVAIPIAETSPASKPTADSPTPLVEITQPSKYDIDLGLIFQTVERDQTNRIISSKWWLLLPPDEVPKLIRSIEDQYDGVIISQFFWSRSGDQVAFFHLVDDEEHIAVSILDIGTGEVQQVTDGIHLDDPYAYLYKSSWSLNDEWLYVEYSDSFVNGQIINVKTKESYSLNSVTQDELLAWSPISEDHYAFITRKNFPESSADEICIGQINNDNPLKCIDNFDQYTVLRAYSPFGSTFSWSLDEENALVVANDGSEKFTYLLLDFKNLDWRPILVDQYFELQRNWSPNNKWIALFAYRMGLRLLKDPENDSELVTVSNSDQVIPLGWLPDNQTLLFQDGCSVYAIKPGESSDSSLIEDFSKVVGENTLGCQIDLLS